MSRLKDLVLMLLSCKYICNNINAFLAERNFCALENTTVISLLDRDGGFFVI